MSPSSSAFLLHGRRCVKYLSSVGFCSSSSGSFAATPLGFRDVFVHDPNFPAVKWDTHRTSLKHPHSGHTMAKYATYIHTNSVYNFNQIGEYSLNVTPIHPWTNRDPEMVTRSNSSTSNEQNNEQAQHTVIIHPDGLQLSGLKETDVAKVSDMILTDTMITTEQAKKALPAYVSVSSSPRLMIIASSCTSNIAATMHVSKTVLQWFQDALERYHPSSTATVLHTDTTGSSSNCALYLASDMKGHRNASNVLILPYEDSFEFVPSAARATDILKKYFELNKGKEMYRTE